MNEGPASRPSRSALFRAFFLTPLIVLPAYLSIAVVVSLYHFVARSPGPVIAPALYYLMDPSGWQALMVIWAYGAAYTWAALAVYGVPMFLILSRFRLANLPIIAVAGAIGGALVQLVTVRRYFTAVGALPHTYIGAVAAAFFWWLVFRPHRDVGSILSGTSAT